MEELKLKFRYYSREVWPYIFRFINFLYIVTIKTMLGGIKRLKQQIGL